MQDWLKTSVNELIIPLSGKIWIPLRSENCSERSHWFSVRTGGSGSGGGFSGSMTERQFLKKLKMAVKASTLQVLHRLKSSSLLPPPSIIPPCPEQFLPDWSWRVIESPRIPWWEPIILARICMRKIVYFSLICWFFDQIKIWMFSKFWWFICWMLLKLSVQKGYTLS